MLFNWYHSTNRKYIPDVKKPAITKNNNVVVYRSGDIIISLEG